MTILESIQAKIVSLPELTERLETLRCSGTQRPKVVFTNGCFDLVHRGHIDYLCRAREMGDILVVGLNSDASVKRLKGPSRPISHQGNRTMVLAAFEFVDFVVLFDDDTPLKLIESIRPDILVKGADYTHATVVGADFVESYGGRLELIPLVSNESTTNLVKRMQ